MSHSCDLVRGTPDGKVDGKADTKAGGKADGETDVKALNLEWRRIVSKT